MDLQFQSFLHAYMTQEVEILPYVSQGIIYFP